MKRCATVCSTSLCENLRAAPTIDAVVLVLHGAMMAHGYPDCEGDLLMRVRARRIKGKLSGKAGLGSARTNESIRVP